MRRMTRDLIDTLGGSLVFLGFFLFWVLTPTIVQAAVLLAAATWYCWVFAKDVKAAVRRRRSKRDGAEARN